jgi:hypothetical protein
MADPDRTRRYSSSTSSTNCGASHQQHANDHRSRRTKYLRLIAGRRRARCRSAALVWRTRRSIRPAPR